MRSEACVYGQVYDQVYDQGSDQVYDQVYDSTTGRKLKSAVSASKTKPQDQVYDQVPMLKNPAKPTPYSQNFQRNFDANP